MNTKGAGQTWRNRICSLAWYALYEDNVLGKVTNEQFRMLSEDYDTEQKSLKERIPKTAECIEELQASIIHCRDIGIVGAFAEEAEKVAEIRQRQTA